jgi:ferric-dicitrate binding protein FerR (iron transport regulator)
MPEKINWKYLLEKFTTNTCTRQELDQFLNLVEQDHDNEELTEELRRHWQKDGSDTTHTIDWKERFSSLLAEAKVKTPEFTQPAPARKIRFVKWASVAAAVLLLAGGYFGFFSKNKASQNPVISGVREEQMSVVEPGGNKATLTLADGSLIDLDSAQNGTIARQGNIKIIKGEDGELLYFVDRQRSATSGYNTLSIPRGGKYSIVLSDGTKVWLNSASSLRFPAAFANGVRNVALTGEGYFEVVKDACMPFQVSARNIMINVLGTHFNVNAYEDERSVATTLLNGCVKVKPLTSRSEVRTALLKPGEQARVASDGRVVIDPHANTGEAVAWKDNNFEFENTPIPVIMRQIARWYNVEIDYKGSVPTHKLTGRFSRTVRLGQLIKMLQYTGVNMKIESNKISIREY